MRYQTIYFNFTIKDKLFEELIYSKESINKKATKSLSI